jgi:hypothetical protein
VVLPGERIYTLTGAILTKSQVVGADSVVVKFRDLGSDLRNRMQTSSRSERCGGKNSLQDNEDDVISDDEGEDEAGVARSAGAPSSPPNPSQDKQTAEPSADACLQFVNLASDALLNLVSEKPLENTSTTTPTAPVATPAEPPTKKKRT